MDNHGLTKRNGIVNIDQIPFPAEKEGHSIVQIQFMGICRTDVAVAENKFPIDDITIGHEVSGSIYQSDDFEVGTYVGIDPYTADGMHGLTEDGYFAKFVSVPNNKIYPIGHQLLATYLEPIAASLLDIDIEQPATVYGTGRIPLIVQYILQLQGIEADLVYETDEIKKYRTVVYSAKGHLNNALQFCDDNGTIIMRSRNHQFEEFDSFEFIRRNLTMKSKYTSSFDEAAEFINRNEDALMQYMGDIYPMDDWKFAFTHSNIADKKTFLTWK